MLRAARKLNDLLDSHNETIAYRAAVALLDLGIKASEIEDLRWRIKKLEAINGGGQ